ncbi:MAG: ATP synthase F1 subunit gamma [Gemmatimonadota bacterium]
MQKARDIKRRIHSVENTRQITSTMELVAASKLRRAQQRVTAARPYAAKLNEVIRSLLTPELSHTHAILRQPEVIRRSALILLTSNRGLAGAFNANLIRLAQRTLEERRRAGVKVEFHVVGKKGIRFFSYRGEAMTTARQDITDRPTMDDARSLVDPLIAQYESGEIDAIEVIYAQFKSAMSTPPALMRVLPVAAGGDEDGRRSHNYLLEPSPDEILKFVLPLYVRNSVYRALVESAAAEQGARRTAMKNATDNANDLIETLTREYNRARQSQITQEIAEIVGGAEALRG